MRMLSSALFKMLAVFCLCALAALGQTGLGTITGTVSDPTGAVVVNARVEAKHVDTGVIYPTVTTDTGNYAIAQLPVGKYEVTVNVQGFKRYERQGLTLAAAQIMRIDVPLQVGANTEAVTVTAEATLLKTESSELVHNVTRTQLEELPILSVGGAGTASSSGYLDPFALARLIPGTIYLGASSFNGIMANGNNDSSIRIEGQPSGNTMFLPTFTGQTQPSVDAIQEVAVQTSNYAAEYGDAGGAILNLTMKSGGNQYHGSLYDYSANEALNAAPSMHTSDKNQTRRFDYGMTFGGPIRFPKIYNGQNKTFFFWGWEQFRENLLAQPGVSGATLPTVPIDQYRVGNFQHVIDGYANNGPANPITVGNSSYVDQLGRSGYVQGQIFDPFSGVPVTCNTTNPGGANYVPNANCTNGVTSIVRNPFPTVNGALSGTPTVNQLPQTAQYMDPVSFKLQKLFPEPLGANATGGLLYGQNYQNPWKSHRTSQIPSLKVDHTVGSKGHLSVYWSTTETESQYSFPFGNAEGFPVPLTAARGTFIYAKTDRVNYDHTLTPSLLLHVAAGWNWTNFNDFSPVAADGYNACTQFGLCGGLQNRTFPSISWSGFFGPSAQTGGMSSVGPAGNIQGSNWEERPSGNASVTYVKGNHNYKVGGEWRLERNPHKNFGADGQYSFATTQTSQTSTADNGGANLQNNNTGFEYASFLMGQTDSVSLTAPAVATMSRQIFGLFLQDTWKVTRKLTLDYGLRWDYGTYLKEEFGRADSFSTTVLNPSAANHPGGSIFEATCHCSFVPNNYPFDIGPRVGFAYQIDRKTVFRGGAGVVYQTPGTTSAPSDIQLTGPAPTNFGGKSTQFSDGVTAIHPVWPTLTPDSNFTPGTINGASQYLDRSFMRAPRIVQFSAGIQREIHRNLVVEASYVGNRGTWLSASGLAPINTISVPLLNQFNMSVPVNGVVTGANLDDRSLLIQNLASESSTQNSLLAAKGVGVVVPGCAPSSATSTAPLCSSLPYPGYPTNGGVRATLIPFPQFTGINAANAPLGKSWYDGLQVNATQRLTHGLTLNANYTFSKTQSLTGSLDPFNAALGKNVSGSDVPHLFRVSAEYTVPRLHSGNKILGNKVLAYVLGDWGLGTYLQYQSAPAMSRPGNVSANFNAVSRNPNATMSVCPYSRPVTQTSGVVKDLGCTDPISDWLGYPGAFGGSPAQLRTDPVTGQPMNPWSVNWTDYAGVHHTDPINVNCRCFDPTKTVVLNPDAWVSVPAGSWPADLTTLRWFRGIRTPTENVNVSRSFRVKERMTLQIRMEFTNVFNRLQLGNPSTGGLATFFSPNNGLFTTGYGTFGNISPLTNGTSPGTPRAGTFVARLQF